MSRSGLADCGTVVTRDELGVRIGRLAPSQRWLGESQLHLTVMVALLPEHVLEQENRMVVVKVH
jgi:hypothetical protein